ncbi:MAG: TlpA disulfide reductase family protein [Chitinophagaceae bacterium]
MNRIFLVWFAMSLACICFGQRIKKMSVIDLEAFINNSEKPLVINFWATFCKPCIEEIPYFQNTIAEKYKGEVELVLVSLDLPDYFPGRISSVAMQKNFTSPIVWLNETNADYFCPMIDKKWSGAIPATLMINNKKNYRKFYEQQLTPLQLERELKGLAN